MIAGLQGRRMVRERRIERRAARTTEALRAGRTVVNVATKREELTVPFDPIKKRSLIRCLLPPPGDAALTLSDRKQLLHIFSVGDTETQVEVFIYGLHAPADKVVRVVM